MATNSSRWMDYMQMLGIWNAQGTMIMLGISNAQGTMTMLGICNAQGTMIKLGISNAQGTILVIKNAQVTILSKLYDPIQGLNEQECLLYI